MLKQRYTFILLFHLPAFTLCIENTLFPANFIVGQRILQFHHFLCSFMDSGMILEEGTDVSFFFSDSGLFLKNMYLCTVETFYSKKYAF